MKLIVLAAGRGVRFLPTTNTKPKGMIRISGKPLLEHVIKPYLPHISDIIFVINNPLGKQIKDYFKKNYLGHKMTYKIQTEPKGTMDALLTCKDLIENNEMFSVCNGDDLLNETDIEKAIKENIIGIGVSKKTMPRSYLGIQVENRNILGFKRHDTENDFVDNTFYNGFNVLDSRVFGFYPITTRNGELGLPQTLFSNIDSYPLKAFFFEHWETVNNPKDLEGAKKFLRNS